MVARSIDQVWASALALVRVVACALALAMAPAVLSGNDDAIVCCQRAGRLHVSHKSDCEAGGSVIHQPGEAKTVRPTAPSDPDQDSVIVTYGPVHSCGRTYEDQTQRLPVGAEWRIGAAWTDTARQGAGAILHVPAGKRVTIGPVEGSAIVLEPGALPGDYALRLLRVGADDWHVRVYAKELIGSAELVTSKVAVTPMLAIALDATDSTRMHALRIRWMDKELSVPMRIE